jgi:hypothetical protein
MSEIALRAVDRGEEQLASSATAALGQIAITYLGIRRDTLRLTLAYFPDVLGSDVNMVLTPVYEELRKVAARAASRSAEMAATEVVGTFAGIAQQVTLLNAAAFPAHAAPLSPLPLHYLQTCVDEYLRRGLRDVALIAVRALGDVARSSPDNIQSTDVHIPALDGISRISQRFLVIDQGALANQCIEEALIVLSDAFRRHHSDAVEMLRHWLEAIENELMPVAMGSPNTAGLPTEPPMSVPYDLTKEASLAHLFESIAQQAVADIQAKNERIRYSRFASVSEVLHSHLRRLAETQQFSESFVVWHLIQTIRKIADVYLWLLASTSVEGRSEVRRLAAEEVPSHLAFCWVYFERADTITLQHLSAATNMLVAVALDFAAATIESFLHDAVSAIAWAARAYLSKVDGGKMDGVVYALEPLLCMALYAEAVSDPFLSGKIEEHLIELFASTTDEARVHIKTVLHNRRDRIRESLAEGKPYQRAVGSLAKALAAKGLV